MDNIIPINGKGEHLSPPSAYYRNNKAGKNRALIVCYSETTQTAYAYQSSSLRPGREAAAWRIWNLTKEDVAYDHVLAWRGSVVDIWTDSSCAFCSKIRGLQAGGGWKVSRIRCSRSE
jgi:hypothetical protein